MTESARMADYAHYDAVAALEERELRVLVREGTSSEKVWAAWHLALSMGPEADGDLTDALAEEPTAGVRAHWIIVLFSHGETDLVAVLAQHDPSPLVRETAVRYLAPTVGRSASITLAPAIAACLTDIAPRVRQTAVRHLSAEPGAELMTRVRGMVDDPDAQVRMAALVYLLDRPGVAASVIEAFASDEDVHVRRRAVEALATTTGGETDWALERIGSESDESARAHLTAALLAAGRQVDLMQHLASHAPLMIHDVMAPLARVDRRFSWLVMAPLFGACPDSPTLLVLCACLDCETIPAGAAEALIEEATAYYEGEELWLPHLIQITRPLLDTLPEETRLGFVALRDLLVDELAAARAQRWGPIEKLEALLVLLQEP